MPGHRCEKVADKPPKNTLAIIRTKSRTKNIMMNTGIAANAHLTMNQTMLVGDLDQGVTASPLTRRSLGEGGSRHFLHEPDDFEIRFEVVSKTGRLQQPSTGA